MKADTGEQRRNNVNCLAQKERLTSVLVSEDSQVFLLVTAKHSIAQVPQQQISLLWHRKDLGQEGTELLLSVWIKVEGLPRVCWIKVGPVIAH